MKTNETLRAVVTYHPATSGKVRFVTKITIKFGDDVVATATLGGKYSQPQALAEFRRQPGRFTRQGDAYLWWRASCQATTRLVKPAGVA